MPFSTSYNDNYHNPHSSHSKSVGVDPIHEPFETTTNQDILPFRTYSPTKNVMWQILPHYFQITNIKHFNLQFEIHVLSNTFKIPILNSLYTVLRKSVQNVFSPFSTIKNYNSKCVVILKQHNLKRVLMKYWLNMQFNKKM